MREGAAGRSHSSPTGGCRGRGPRTTAGARAARRHHWRRAREHGAGVAAGVLALQRRGCGAHVPRRGAAAHPRWRHARRADPRQGRARRLARPPGAQQLAVRQRRRLGPARHRAARVHPRRARPRKRAHAHHRQARRAGDPQGGEPRHAPDGTAIRRRRIHCRGARQRAPLRGDGLALLVRHAGRGGDDRGRCAALSPRVRGRHRRHRHRRRRSRPPRRPGHLHQALGAASALRVRAARADDGGALPAPAGSRAARAALRHRHQHRRRRGRSPRAVPRSARAALPRAEARRLEWRGLRRPGVPEALPLRGGFPRRPRTRAATG